MKWKEYLQEKVSFDKSKFKDVSPEGKFEIGRWVVKSIPTRIISIWSRKNKYYVSFENSKEDLKQKEFKSQKEAEIFVTNTLNGNKFN